MMRRRAALLAALVGLTACQPLVTTVTPKARPEVATKTKPRPSASPSASVSPTASPPLPATSASPSPQVSASAAIAPSPDVPTRALSGLVKMDSSYLVSAGGANVISNNGGNVLALAAGTLINAGGGSVISNNGGGAIAVKVGLIGNNGGGYRLLASTDGTLLPVQGMAVVPVSLVTGQPLGPAVLTDAAGRYQVTVPQSEVKNVLIFTSVPGTHESDSRLSDPRLRLGQIVNPAKTGEQLVDEDGALITSYVLTSLINRVRRLFEADDIDYVLRTVIFTDTLAELPVSLKTLLAAGIKELRAEADAAQFRKMSERDKALFLHQILDMVIANVRDPDLDAIAVKANHLTHFSADEPPLENRPSTQVFRELITYLRPKVQAKLESDPAFFDKQSYFTKANQYQALNGRPAYTIKRVSDVMDFIVKAFMSEGYDDETNTISGVDVDSPDLGAKLVFDSIDARSMPIAGDPRPAAAYPTELVLRAAYLSLFEAIMQVMLQDTVRTATIARMKAYRPRDPLNP